MTEDERFVEEVSGAFKSDQIKWNAFTMARLIDLARIGAVVKAAVEKAELSRKKP